MLLGDLVTSKCCAAACLAALVLVNGLFVAPAGAAPEPLGNVAEESEHVPGQLVVRYAGDADRSELREQYDLAKIEPLGIPNGELVRVEAGTVAEATAELTADPGVLYAEPNYVYRASAVPDDPLFPQLWGLHQTSDVDVDAPQAWDVTTGSPAVTVAVVDTGVALDHPDLAPNMWRNPGESGGGKESNGVDDDGNGYVDDFQGWDFVGDDSKPRDLHGHGTHVAATIGAAGDNGNGITGVAWNSRLMPLRSLNSNGLGTSADLAGAFTYAARNGAKVVNVSLGGHAHSLAVLNAISAAPDTLFVVAAGNAGANNDVGSSYPCNYPAPNIVCVAAMDSTDRLAGFSNYGATTVDLAAPGVGILSLQPAFDTRFSEDFSGGFARWAVGGVNGTWTADPEGVAVDSPGGNYQDNADHWLATETPFDLGGMNDCLLRYSVKLDVEQGNDRFVVEASRDGSTWDAVGAWTGSTGGEWDRITESLFAYDGAHAVYVRFRLVSNGSVTGDGATLDAIAVRCNSATYSGSELLTADGTSMATPHVAGAAALAWSAQPDASPLSVARALVDGAEDGPSYAGKTVSGGRLNACRTVVLVASLSGERCADGTGAAPAPSPTPASTPTPVPSASPSPTPSASPTPMPTPSSSPAPSASPTPTPDPTPTPVASPSPSPEPSATTTPSPSPEPTPDAEPEPNESEPLYVHDRTVTLRLEEGVVARGRVRAPGYDACASHVRVKIVRKGKVVDKVETRTNGRFRAKLPDKPGRYAAIAPEIVPDDTNLCARARSKTRRI